MTIPASLVAQMVKNLSAMWETQVQSVGQEDPLEKEMAPHSSILAWRIPWTEEPGRLQSTGSQRVGHNWESYFTSSLYNHKGFDLGHTWMVCGFPYFIQFKPEFCNKELMIWVTMSSRSCFCWLYRASPSLAAKNVTNLISVLIIWWCPCVESSLVLLEEDVCYD